MRITFKGSITVFMALLLTSILALSGAVLEIVRYSGMKNVVIEAENNAGHSLCSNYNQKLWNQYHIYGLSCNYPVLQGTKRYIEMGMGNESDSKGVDFYKGEVGQVQLVGNKRLTDFEGEDYFQQAVRYQKIHFPKILIEKWKDYGKRQQNEAESVSDQNTIELSQSAMDELKDDKWKEKKGEPVTHKDAKEYENLKNPVTEYGNLTGGLLSQLVVEDPSKISTCKMRSSCMQSFEEMEKGSLAQSETEESQVTNQLLFVSYLAQHYSSFVLPQKDRGMQYQLEYILTGKDNDANALESTLQRMKWLRIGVNYLYLFTSSVQSQKAMAYAVALVGFTGIEPLIEAVKLGILYVWAYSETIKELKCLAAGKTIPILKTDQNFRTDLKQLFTAGPNTNWDQDQGLKIGYTEMIQLLLVMEQPTKQRLRSIHCINMDLTGKEEKNETLSMDQFYSGLELRVGIQFDNIFACLNQQNKKPRFPYCYERTYHIGYLQEENND